MKQGSDRQVILDLVSDRFVENARQYFTEQSGDHEYQYDDEYRRSAVDKEAACCDHCDEKAVDAHLFKTHHILPDETVIVDDRAKHLAELLYDQDREDPRQEEDHAE